MGYLLQRMINVPIYNTYFVLGFLSLVYCYLEFSKGKGLLPVSNLNTSDTIGASVGSDMILNIESQKATESVNRGRQLNSIQVSGLFKKLFITRSPVELFLYGLSFFALGNYEYFTFFKL